MYAEYELVFIMYDIINNLLFRCHIDMYMLLSHDRQMDHGNSSAYTRKTTANP